MRKKGQAIPYWVVLNSLLGWRRKTLGLEKKEPISGFWVSK